MSCRTQARNCGGLALQLGGGFDLRPGDEVDRIGVNRAGEQDDVAAFDARWRIMRR